MRLSEIEGLPTSPNQPVPPRPGQRSFGELIYDSADVNNRDVTGVADGRDFRLSELPPADGIRLSDLPEPTEADYDPAVLDLAYDRYSEAVGGDQQKFTQDQFIANGQHIEWADNIAQDRSHFQKIQDSFSRGKQSAKLSRDYWSAVMDGKGDAEEIYRDYRKAQAEQTYDPIDGSNFITDAQYGSAGVVGGLKGAFDYSLKFGIAGAGAGFVGGNLTGIGLVLPEEVATVPAGFLTGMKIGATAFWYQQGSGSMMLSMRDMGIDNNSSKVVSNLAGIPYAALEYLQVSKLAPQVKVGLGTVINSSLNNVVTKAAAQYGKRWGTEVLTEVLQEGTAIIAEESAKYLNQNEIDVDFATYEEVVDRMVNTGVEAAKATALLAVPGTMVETQKSLQNIQPPVDNGSLPQATPVSDDVRADFTDFLESVGQLEDDSVFSDAAITTAFESGNTYQESLDLVKGISDSAETVVNKGNIGALAETGGKSIRANTRNISGVDKKGITNKWQNFSESIKDVAARTHFKWLGMRQLGRFLDGGEDGYVSRTIIQPGLNAARRAHLAINSSATDLHQSLVENIGVDLKHWSSPNSAEVFVDSKGNQFELTQDMKVDIYLASLDKKATKTLKQGNGYSQKDIDTVVDSMNPQELAVADHLLGWYGDKHSQLTNTYNKATGKELGRLENYSYRKTDYSRSGLENADTDIEDILGLKPKTTKKGKTPSITKQRKGSQVPMQLGALTNALSYLQIADRYTNTALVLKDVSALVNDPRIGKQLNKASRGNAQNVINTWIDNVGRNQGHAVDSQIGKTLNALRRNAVTAALGMNIVTAMRQPISFFMGISDDPKMLTQAVSTMYQAVRNGEVTKLYEKAASKSKLVKSRNMEREIVEILSDTNIPTLFGGKKKLSKAAMALTVMMDRSTVGVVWNTAYDSAIADGMSEAQAIEKADGVIERTQPMGNIEDLPHFFRGGAIEKMFTAFKNQINKNYNYWANDIVLAKKRGKIDNPQLAYRVMMSYFLPATLMSLVSHGGSASKEDYIKDMASYAITPFYWLGGIASSMVQGFDPNTNLALSWADNVKAAAEAKSLGVGLKHGVKAAGKLAGVPISQPIRTITGGHDIWTGDTDDWRRLVWSSTQINESYNDKKKISRRSTRRRRRR